MLAIALSSSRGGPESLLTFRHFVETTLINFRQSGIRLLQSLFGVLLFTFFFYIARGLS